MVNHTEGLEVIEKKSYPFLSCHPAGHSVYSQRGILLGKEHLSRRLSSYYKLNRQINGTDTTCHNFTSNASSKIYRVLIRARFFGLRSYHNLSLFGDYPSIHTAAKEGCKGLSDNKCYAF